MRKCVVPCAVPRPEIKNEIPKWGKGFSVLSDLPECFYCKKSGHIKSQCWKLLSKGRDKAPVKPVALVSTLIPGHAGTLTPDSQSGAPTEALGPTGCKAYEKPGEDEVPAEFKDFVSDGWMSPRKVVFGGHIERYRSLSVFLTRRFHLIRRHWDNIP